MHLSGIRCVTQRIPYSTSHGRGKEQNSGDLELRVSAFLGARVAPGWVDDGRVSGGDGRGRKVGFPGRGAGGGGFGVVPAEFDE